MNRQLLIFCFSLIGSSTYSQNLIPNGSFELVKKEINEHISGSRAAFNSKVHAWYSPTEVSPDIYLPHPNNASFPENFKLPTAKEGRHFIGLVLDYPYSACKNYKEYVQVKLKDTLIIGTSYQLEFWVTPRLTDTYNIGVFLSKEAAINDKCSMLEKQAQLHFKEELIKDKWTKISFEFKPSERYAYITIGNFERRKNAENRYCYFDDFKLKEKTNDPLPIASTDTISTVDNQVEETSEIESIFNPNNIQFEQGKYDLQSKSFGELDQLVNYLSNNPSKTIVIEGHTDNTGSEKSNLLLSTNRTNTIRDYLMEKGIDLNRINSRAYGATQPIATNETEIGRQLNRRVTFKIL